MAYSWFVAHIDIAAAVIAGAQMLHSGGSSSRSSSPLAQIRSPFPAGSPSISAPHTSHSTRSFGCCSCCADKTFGDSEFRLGETFRLDADIETKSSAERKQTTRVCTIKCCPIQRWFVWRCAYSQHMLLQTLYMDGASIPGTASGHRILVIVSHAESHGPLQQSDEA